MKSFFKPLLPVLCLLALLSGGCTAAYTGLSGNTMYSNDLADMAIAPISGLVPVAYGSYTGKMKSDNTIDPVANVAYAIYGDPDGQVVKRHAHIIFAELQSKETYQMTAESFTRSNEMSLRGVKFDRRDWTEHVLYETRQGDWFTEFWDMNGYITPQIWLGKRWSRSYDMSSRIVLEYREPLPSCARVNDKKLLVVLNDVALDMPTPECRAEVEAIFARADKAFSMRRPATVNTSQPAPAEVLPAKPARSLDLERYVGEAVYISKQAE